MKKIIIAILSLAFFVGCAPTRPGAPPPTPPGAPAPPPPPPAP